MLCSTSADTRRVSLSYLLACIVTHTTKGIKVETIGHFFSVKIGNFATPEPGGAAHTVIVPGQMHGWHWETT